MANYTITKFQTTESVGDSIFFNNMVTSGTVTITPNSTYVVSASDFSISSLPTGIASVVFTDSTTAGTTTVKMTDAAHTGDYTKILPDVIELAAETTAGNT